MPFDWEEYLNVALFLAEGAHGLDREAALRSAVSRAYYGAYGQAMRYVMRNHSFVPSKHESDHSQVRRILQIRRQGSARRLADLQEARETCDYDHDDIAHLEEMVADALEKAKFVIADLRLRDG